MNYRNYLSNLQKISKEEQSFVGIRSIKLSPISIEFLRITTKRFDVGTHYNWQGPPRGVIVNHIWTIIHAEIFIITIIAPKQYTQARVNKAPKREFF